MDQIGMHKLNQVLSKQPAQSHGTRSVTLHQEREREREREGEGEREGGREGGDERRREAGETHGSPACRHTRTRHETTPHERMYLFRLLYPSTYAFVMVIALYDTRLVCDALEFSFCR